MVLLAARTADAPGDPRFEVVDRSFRTAGRQVVGTVRSAYGEPGSGPPRRHIRTRWRSAGGLEVDAASSLRSNGLQPSRATTVLLGSASGTFGNANGGKCSRNDNGTNKKLG